MGYETEGRGVGCLDTTVGCNDTVRFHVHMIMIQIFFVSSALYPPTTSDIISAQPL